ncbi:hypothetical protein [Thalassoroseus pseudoceratinae]|uniref:hypothetical protein n=1 Tax=Thalassoroseus pseudoceratinae TaxID=2713176 RepID=UPI001421D2A0|nr:hypothetical protein [Thalassoroseus pseudoceratinae]
MPSITNAGNTFIPCLQAIVAKGYTVTHYFLGDEPDDWENPQWDADKDGQHYNATSLPELLGLIANWEVRGDDWQIKSGESELFHQLVDAAPTYDNDGNAVHT